MHSTRTNFNGIRGEMVRYGVLPNRQYRIENPRTVSYLDHF